MDIVHPRAGAPAFRDPASLNDALLGLACDENREAWESLSATATMVLSKSGGSIRTIVTGRRIITTGVYASRKTGCGHPYESMLEKAFFMLCEVDTDVVDYRAQPFRFEFVVDGIKRAYLPDAVTLRADGTVEVIEIKRDPGDLRDPEYRLKLQAVREICDRIGWRFRILFRTDLTEPSRFYRAVEDVQSWAFTKFSDAEVFEVVHRRACCPAGADRDPRRLPADAGEAGPPAAAGRVELARCCFRPWRAARRRGTPCRSWLSHPAFELRHKA